MSILNGTADDLKTGRTSIIHDHTKYIALGELKGGIDPAGADEHWKTANSALNRIRTSFSKEKLTPQTFFIGAAIENSMASEIFKQLQTGSMTNAANLTNDEQLTEICNWVVHL
ncbi:Type-2 restriction enzyme BsoBI [anaerobic digester metagenome]